MATIVGVRFRNAGKLYYFSRPAVAHGGRRGHC